MDGDNGLEDAAVEVFVDEPLTLVDRLKETALEKERIKSVDSLDSETLEYTSNLLEGLEKTVKEEVARLGRRIDQMVNILKTPTGRNVHNSIKQLIYDSDRICKKVSEVKELAEKTRGSWQRKIIEGLENTVVQKASVDDSKLDTIYSAIVDLKHTVENSLGNKGIKNNKETNDVVIKSQGSEPFRRQNVEAWVEVANKKTRKTEVKKKSPAIIIKTGPVSYVEALKKIRAEPTLKELSKDIVAMRRTEAGHLLVEMSRGSATVDRVNSAIKNAVGDEIIVSTLQNRTRIGVFGLDEITTQEEVMEAIESMLDQQNSGMEIKITLRTLPRGQKMAILTMAPELARRILEQGHLRVGYVSCRARLWVDKKRCFRCLVFGHNTRDCTGPDRTNCCRGCGQEGHLIKSCNQHEEQRRAFGEKLKKEEAVWESRSAGEPALTRRSRVSSFRESGTAQC